MNYIDHRMNIRILVPIILIFNVINNNHCDLIFKSKLFTYICLNLN